MNSREEKERILRSNPQGDLESPFLEAELFVAEFDDEWEARLVVLQSESPFAHAFEESPKSVVEPEFYQEETAELDRTEEKYLLVQEEDTEESDLTHGLDRETAKGLCKKLKNLSFLPHFAEVNGNDVVLTPGVMDPKIYDGPVKYKVSAPLQECLNEVMKRKKELSHIKVALVDLTKNTLQPEFAAFNHKDQVFAASIPKIATMLAAFQLRHDLQVAFKQKGAKTIDELFDLVRDDWSNAQVDPGGKATPFTSGVSLRGRFVLVNGKKVTLDEPKAPKLDSVFADVPAVNPVIIEFSSTGEDKARLKTIIDEFNKKKTGSRKNLDALGFLERMRVMIGGMVPSSNYATSTIVRDVGFLYIASTLLQSGLYDTNRKGGLWLGADYRGGKWKRPLGGGAMQSATAGSLAAFMTLLVQDKLVSPKASEEMRMLMKKEPNPTHPGIVSCFKEGLKEGLPDDGSLKIVLSKLGVKGGVDDCAFIEREVNANSGRKVLRYVAVGLRAKSKDKLKALILELDKCVLANNGLTPAHGGHLEIKESFKEPEFYEEETGEKSEEIMEESFPEYLGKQEEEFSENETPYADEERETTALDKQLAKTGFEEGTEYQGDEAPSEPYLFDKEEGPMRYEPELSVLGLREFKESRQEIILVAGANYPAFNKYGSHWKRSRALSAGPWREFCLRLAVHRLRQDPTLKITLFDFLLGTREDVRLGAKNKAKTTVEYSFVAPTADDYWNLVDFDITNLLSVGTAFIEPAANRTSFNTDPTIRYFDGATLLSSQGKSIKLLDYLKATSKVTKPVISITDVYLYIESFAGTAKKCTLRELHFFAHSFNIIRGHYSGGPILLNSPDMNPVGADRHPLDKDARASKDFRKPTMDPTKFAQAFAANAKCFVWGCNFQRGFLRQFVHQVGKNARTLAASQAMKISYSSGWGTESEFRTRLGLSDTASLKNVRVELKKVESILRDVNQTTYMQKLATASGHPVIGGPPGTYADYDSKKSPLALMHIPMSKDPFRDTNVSFERVLLFFKDHLGQKFDTTFGNHRRLGRGYMIYEP